MKRSLFVLILMAILFSSCLSTEEESSMEDETSVFNPNQEEGFSYQRYCEENGGFWNEKSNDCEGLSQAVCEAQNGTFNECASACRGDPDAQICTLQCVITCDFNN